MSAPNAIQDAIKTYLQAHPWFTTPTAIGIYSADEGDLTAKLESSLGPLGTPAVGQVAATGGGLAILIGCPYGSNSNMASAAVLLDSSIDIECVEMPIICRATGGLNKTAYQSGRILAAHYTIAGTGGLHMHKCAGVMLRTKSLDKLSGDEERGTLVQTVTFSFNENIT